MKNIIAILIVLLAVLFTVSLSQEKKDTTITISTPAIERQLSQMKEEIGKQQKNLEDAVKYVDNTKQNILILQSQMQALGAVLQDKSLQVEHKTKK